MESKGKNKIIIVVLVLLIIITVALGSYTIYNKFISKPNNNKIDTNDGAKTDSQNTDLSKLIESNGYKVLSDKGHMYLVKKDDNGYKVVYDIGPDVSYIGIYDNKLYYSYTSIKYIDLNKSELTEEKWIDIPQFECSEPSCEPLIVYDAKIVNDTLYFMVNVQGLGRENTDGLLSISMNASKFEDHKKISLIAKQWFVDEKEENIYYYMGYSENDNAVYRYNIASSESEKLFNTSESYSNNISYVPGNIVYYNDEKDELSLYNIESKEFTVLSNNLHEVTRLNGSMWGISSVVGKNLYYYDGKGNIMKYDSTTGKTTNYYTIEDTFYYRGYTFYDDNNFKITYDCDKYHRNEEGHTCTKNEDYVSNKKIVEHFPNIDVVMLDGSIKTFTMEDFELR